jgi:hypothetical protein
MSIKNKTKKSTASGILALGFAAAALPFTVSTADANGNTTEKVTASRTVTLSADIPKLCKFGSGFGDITVNVDHNGDVAPIPVTKYANITCNTAADVELESANGGMVHDGNPDNLGGDYLTSFDYTARLLHGGQELAKLNTANESFDGPESSGVKEGFASGNVPHNQTLDLEIKPENVSGVLQAGNYRDSLTVKVIPQ